jgi:hypothetical protein
VHGYLSHALTRLFNALQSVNATTSSTRNERGSLRVFLKTRNRKEQLMWIKTSLIALGLVGTMAAATPAPTLAQGVYIGPGGVGVDIGRPGYRERRYRDYNDDYAYDRRFRGGCRTVTIERDDGSMRTIRRCD